MSSKRIRSLKNALFCAGWIHFWGTSALADDLFDPSTLLNSTIANAIVKSIGLGMDYRAYEPATPLGTAAGVDIGIEATISKLPDDATTAISAITGASSGDSGSTIPILPSARFHLHKGLGNSTDIGISYLPPVSSIPIIGGSYLFGADLKICLYRPEEGVTWSIRTSYNINNIKIQQITIRTTTISPQLVISKQLDFADPYIGGGVQYATGSVSATIDLPALPAPAPVIGPVTLSDEGKGFGGVLFGGISLKVPNAGLRLTLEGAYSTVGATYMGTKIGFSF
jgi:hypothetical protein